MSTLRISPREYKQIIIDLVPRQGEWSEEEYLVLTDHSNRLVEFTDGFLEVLPAPTDRRQSNLGCLLLLFPGFVGPQGGKGQFCGLCVKIRDGKFREPDLLLVKEGKNPRRENRFWTGADLALEVVSKDKPERDLIDKRHDYAEVLIPEYWIVNPLDETITVLTLGKKKYRKHGQFRREQSATSVILPDFSVDVSAVFDAD